MLNLYKFHHTPESLKAYDQEVPYKLYWEEYGVGEYRDKSQIEDNPKMAYDYAIKISEGMFPKGENIISDNPEYAYEYARFIIKERFPEGEDAIMDSKYKDDYLHFLKEKGIEL